MRFRNSIRLLIDNFGNVYKLFFFRLVTGALFLSAAYVIVTFGLHVIIESAEAERIILLLGDFLQALVTGNTGFLNGFQAAFTSAVTDFFQLILTNIGSIVWSVVGMCLIYLLSRFLNGTALFAVGSVLNDKLESYSRTTFSSAYTKSSGKAMLYQIIYVPLTFVYDVLAILACWFFFFYTPSFLPSWGILTVFFGLSLAMLAFVCLQALKMACISSWIPSVVTGDEKVGSGFAASFRRLHGFGGRFSAYFVSIYLVIVVNALFAVFTFGSALLFTVPASYLFILCVQFVYYYEDTGKKFFLSFRKISGADGKPEGMGD